MLSYVFVVIKIKSLTITRMITYWLVVSLVICKVSIITFLSRNLFALSILEMINIADPQR